MPFIHEISPVLVELGPLRVHWYGLMYALGIAANFGILTWIFKREKYDLKHLDSLILWLFIGLVIGARLGHVFFYSWDYYSANFEQIFYIWQGGLASHGGAIGILIAYLLWCWRKKVDRSKYLNAIVVPMPLTAAFVRVGNFFNSEIVGHPTGSDWGVIFALRGEDFARHPVQLYSAAMNLVIFGLLLFVYKRYYKKMPPVSLMFLYVLVYFSGRFIVEFWKDLPGPLPEGSAVTMGQVLSVGPILVALFYFGLLGWTYWLKQKKRG